MRLFFTFSFPPDFGEGQRTVGNASLRSYRTILHTECLCSVKIGAEDRCSDCFMAGDRCIIASAPSQMDLRFTGPGNSSASPPTWRTEAEARCEKAPKSNLSFGQFTKDNKASAPDDGTDVRLTGAPGRWRPACMDVAEKHADNRDLLLGNHRSRPSCFRG